MDRLRPGHTFRVPLVPLEDALAVPVGVDTVGDDETCIPVGGRGRSSWRTAEGPRFLAGTMASGTCSSVNDVTSIAVEYTS